jgi:hypothetical protein
LFVVPARPCVRAGPERPEGFRVNDRRT